MNGSPPFLIGVTGTDGKTSMVEACRQVLGAAFPTTVSVGTLGVVAPPRVLRRCRFDELPDDVPTRMVAAARAGATHVAAEAYSGALASGGWDDVELDVAIVTSFGHDHLDLHLNRDRYAAAKLHLLDLVRPGGLVLIDTTCALSSRVHDHAAALACDVRSYGRGGDAMAVDANGTTGPVTLASETRHLRFGFHGAAFVRNVEAAAIVARRAGVPSERVWAALPAVAAPPGRMELLGVDRGAAVFVDAGHTPEALAAALRTARSCATGRVLVVFGAGGDRSPFKRRAMGAAAAALADVVVLTDDNPRREHPVDVRGDVLAGCPDAIEVPGRARAIDAILARAGSGDVVVVAGRGHEQWLERDGRRVAHSDLAQVRATIDQPVAAAARSSSI